MGNSSKRPLEREIFSRGEGNLSSEFTDRGFSYIDRVFFGFGLGDICPPDLGGMTLYLLH